MKKFLLLTIVMVMISCNKKKEDPIPAEPAQPLVAEKIDCDSEPLVQELDALIKSDAGSETILKWLDEKGYPFCEGELIECLGEFHDISEESYNNMAKHHSSNTSGIKEYRKSWPEVEEFLKNIKCWENHLEISFDGNDQIVFTQKPFDINTINYSKPLFLSLARQYSLDKDDIFYFSKAMELDSNGNSTGKETVIFRLQVTMGSAIKSYFYDLSDVPAIIENLNSEKK